MTCNSFGLPKPSLDAKRMDYMCCVYLVVDLADIPSGCPRAGQLRIGGFCCSTESSMFIMHRCPLALCAYAQGGIIDQLLPGLAC